MDIEQAVWAAQGWERLADGVGRRRLPGWDATTGLVVGDKAVLLYDTGATLAEGAEIRAQAEAITGGRRVTHIALGHPHFDHVLGTAAFAGAEVFGAVGMDDLLGSARTREELYEDAVRQGVEEGAAAEAAEALVAPRHTVTGEWTLDLGGRQVLLANVGPGHTGHDLVLLVPGERETVFCGDLVEESGDPAVDRDSDLQAWPSTLGRVLDAGGHDAMFIPGHGAVVDAGFVRRQQEWLRSRV